MGEEKTITWLLFYIYVLGTSLHAKQTCSIEPHRVAHSNNIFLDQERNCLEVNFYTFCLQQHSENFLIRSLV